jgi:hypothetical protein
VDTFEPPIESQVKKPIAGVVGYLVATFLVAAACLWAADSLRHSAQASAKLKAAAGQIAAVPAVLSDHLPMPHEVRGIYVTASTASSFSRYEKLVSSVKAKGVNAVVLDLKGENGSLAFAPESEELRDAPVKELYDLDKIVAATHALGIYVIARMPVFEDPAFAAVHPKDALKRVGGSLWRDAKGLYWLDPAAESVWKYNADIALEAHERGCDEIQFDYIRFATDGKTSQIVFPYYDAKAEKMRNVIGRLFVYFEQNLRERGVPISVDVFGFVTWHQTDLGIGQWYADALASFDAVSPMVYPSHYPSGTLGFANPAQHPYEIVVDSLKKGNEVIGQMKAGGLVLPRATQRPWLQAFNLGAKYTPEMVLAQVRAARDEGASGFLLWNAGNDYSSLPDLTI